MELEGKGLVRVNVASGREPFYATLQCFDSIVKMRSKRNISREKQNQCCVLGGPTKLHTRERNEGTGHRGWFIL